MYFQIVQGIEYVFSRVAFFCEYAGIFSSEKLSKGRKS